MKQGKPLSKQDIAAIDAKAAELKQIGVDSWNLQ
jgi:hypothetical protein